MSVQHTAPKPFDTGHRPALNIAEANLAYRRAWWSLALLPVAMVAAFVIGEGMLSLLDDGVGDPPFWAVLVSSTPALLVFMIPSVLAMIQGRKAIRLGRPDGKQPALIGAAIGLGFVAVNLLSYAAQTIFG